MFEFFNKLLDSDYPAEPQPPVPSTDSDTDYATEVLNTCFIHATQLLSAQLPTVEDCKFDYLPEFKKLLIHYYLIGVMWRFGEQFDQDRLVGARDRAFVTLAKYLVDVEGMSLKNAMSRTAWLNSISVQADGQPSLGITVGYEAGEKEGALLTLFKYYRNDSRVSGAAFRLVDRAKPVSGILSIASIIISLLLGIDWLKALGIGGVIGISALAALYALYLKFFEHTSFIQTPLPLISIMAFITGIMSILMGLLAELVMRTYYESQDKPVYLVKTTLNLAGAHPCAD